MYFESPPSDRSLYSNLVLVPTSFVLGRPTSPAETGTLQPPQLPPHPPLDFSNFLLS